jgi:hypothetical protein
MLVTRHREGHLRQGNASPPRLQTIQIPSMLFTMIVLNLGFEPIRYMTEISSSSRQ